tara:strand:+ start:4937 stop:5377 length:441 start_codon:yes stop_codon:yes gene_type:complete
MTLDDLLGKFHTPIEAATVANLGRTAAWHWFAKGTKRSLPSVRTLVLWSDHFKLTNEELGSVIRDQSRLRIEIHAEHLRAKEVRKRERRAEAAERSRRRRTEQAKKRASALQSRLDENVEKEIDWEEKEKILELKRIEKLLEEQLK